MQSKNNLISGEPLTYERVNGVVYARYANRSDIPRWVIGGDPDAVSKATGNLFSYSEYQDMMRIAKTNETLKIQMQKLLNIYYILKDDA